MSVIPYALRDSREIVLRHNDAVVIRDPQSKQLILRGTSAPSASIADCPYCHQPLRSSSPEREQRTSNRHESFVSPEYFRMLQLASDGSDDERQTPSSPIRRLVGHTWSSPRASDSDPVSDAEFVAATPADLDTREGHGIQRDSFSPNYFKRFFREEKELGRGGKGVVLLVRHELDGVTLGHFACKRVPVGDDHAWLEKVLVEVQLLQRLSHPNLVSYRHVWLEDVKLNRFGPSVPCAFILQEYCNAGDLLHYVVGDIPVVLTAKEQLKEQMRRKSKGQSDRPRDSTLQRKLPLEEIYSFFKDITSGLAHLHASNYIHRDLKPSNCLLHKGGNEFKCLISDFGEVQAEHVMRKSTGATGTISYCAPEVLRRDSFGRYANFTTKSDIFSLGMILYFMCFSRLPYSSAENIHEEFEDLDQLRAEISSWSGFHEERRERPDLPDQLYDFLRRLLAIDPLGRPSADEILHAIRTESGLESPRLGRGDTSGSIALAVGRRIQSLDSPAPGTPDSGGGHALSEDGGEDMPLPSEMTPRSEPSPTRKSEDMIVPDDQSQDSKTPLLMPPPSTIFSDIRNQVAVYRHYAFSLTMLYFQFLTLGIKLLFFVIKIFVLTKPCQPLATNPLVAYPLLVLAALDVGLGAGIDWRISGLLAVAHCAIQVLAAMGGGLCEDG